MGSWEAGVGATVSTVHRSSVPPMSVEKAEVVQEKAEKLQHQPTSPEQPFPHHSPSGKATSAAQSWGRGEATVPSKSQRYSLLPPAFAAVCGGATPRHQGRLGRGSCY